MARYSGGALTGAGSTTLPVIALYAGATGSPVLSGLRIWNTTATPVDFELVRVTTAGTWTAITEGAWRDRAAATIAQMFHTASGTAPTIGTRLGLFYSLGGAIGSGVMDDFGPDGIEIPTGVANGIALVPLGTGQAVRATLIYEDF
jgi:hypothetical protein